MTSKGLWLIFITLLILTEVNSLHIFGGLTKVVEGVKCGLHRVGERLHNHEHNSDPCEEKQAGPNEIEHDKNYHNNYNNAALNSPSTPRPTSSSTATATVTATSTLTSTSASQSSTTPELGKRLINTGANCPDGYRADAAGKCYLAY